MAKADEDEPGDRGRRHGGAAGGRKPTRAELDLWSHYTRDVAPLSQARRRPAGEPPGDARAQGAAGPPPRAPSPPPGEAPPPSRHKREPAAPSSAPAPAPVSGAMAGVDRRTAERLRRGRLPIEARLDLHGMTREAARQALAAFIHRAADRGQRCVLVITGKGGGQGETGVLRREVPGWLALPDVRGRIITFVEARPRHGGAGALYVLLRRRRGE